MKQLVMTPELSAMIKAAVGEDVETDTLAVFETIALNNLPLPGKDGSIFQDAVITPDTLASMAAWINGENGHLPLVVDHQLGGAPKGRVFHAGVDYAGDGTFELRELFYLSEKTDADAIASLNAGIWDEVSVSFLSKELLCSECSWDYFGPEAQPLNFYEHTCANGHEIGVDGVHPIMEGVAQFIETSLVARGAADKPKIVGKSQSKLAPTNDNEFRLAASGFELNELVLQASIGKEENIMSDKLIADLMASTKEVATLSVEKVNLTAERDAAKTALTASEAKVVELTAEVATLKDSKPADYDSAKAEQAEAIAYFGEQFDHLTVASGKPKVEGDARPKTVADFKAKIGEMTNNLTSILPVGGVADTSKDKADKVATFNADAYALRR